MPFVFLSVVFDLWMERPRLRITWNRTFLWSILRLLYLPQVRLIDQSELKMNCRLWSVNRSVRFGYSLGSSLYRIYIQGMFYTWLLNSTLGQLIESLIIADRVLYLQKHGAQCRVDCVFDRKQSPRCMCITAIKEWSCLLCNPVVFHNKTTCFMGHLFLKTNNQTTCSRNND